MTPTEIKAERAKVNEAGLQAIHQQNIDREVEKKFRNVLTFLMIYEMMISVWKCFYT